MLATRCGNAPQDGIIENADAAADHRVVVKYAAVAHDRARADFHPFANDGISADHHVGRDLGRGMYRCLPHHRHPYLSKARRERGDRLTGQTPGHHLAIALAHLGVAVEEKVGFDRGGSAAGPIIDGVRAARAATRLVLE